VTFDREDLGMDARESSATADMAEGEAGPSVRSMQDLGHLRTAFDAWREFAVRRATGHTGRKWQKNEGGGLSDNPTSWSTLLQHGMSWHSSSQKWPMDKLASRRLRFGKGVIQGTHTKLWAALAEIYILVTLAHPPIPFLPPPKPVRMVGEAIAED